MPNKWRAWRPKVLVNFALTWDGKVSTRSRTPANFSSPCDKRRLLEIRAMGDALLVGRKTFETDNMTMGIPAADLRQERIERGQPPYPIRVITTASGRLDPKARAFQHPFSPILVYSTQAMPGKTREALAAVATLHLAPALDLKAMLTELKSRYRVKSLVCEGGPTLLRSLLEQDLVDELFLTLCPRLFGGTEAPTLTGPAGEFLSQSRSLQMISMETSGDECFLRYRVPA